MKELDARKLDCPAPVIMTKETIEAEHPKLIRIVLDNEAAKENVSRFLDSKNYEVSVEQSGDIFYVSGQKGDGESTEAVIEPKDENVEQQKITVMITTDRMGNGDDELGLKLMINFIKTLKEMGSDLWRLVFVNAGVKLTIAGSEAIDSLKELEKSGINIMVCGTCLDHFHLLAQKEVGQTTNMLDIVMVLQFADKVVNL